MPACLADAKDLRSQGQLKLPQLVSDFRLVAKSFAATHAGKPSAGSAFFARMEFSKNKDLFGRCVAGSKTCSSVWDVRAITVMHRIRPLCRMGIQALPYLARIPPSLAITEGGAVTLGKEEVMSQAGYPWSAETMAEWVLDRSGVAVGEIKRPTLLSTRWGGWCQSSICFCRNIAGPSSLPCAWCRLMPVVSLLVLGGLGFVAYHLYYAPFMRHQWLYALGAIVVYWFSVSGELACLCLSPRRVEFVWYYQFQTTIDGWPAGGMYNIIRGVPLVGFDQRKRQSMLFMPGQGE